MSLSEQRLVLLGRLCKTMSEWRPPGRLGAITCLRCLHSPFREAVVLERLPEPIVHDFLAELDVVAARRIVEFRDAYEAELFAADLGVDLASDPEVLADMMERVDAEIWDFIARSSSDIDQVWRRRLEPRIEDWLTEVGMPLHDGDLPQWLPRLE